MRESTSIRESLKRCNGVLRGVLVTATLLGVLTITACPGPKPPVPTDAQDACPLPKTTVATWFHSGSITANGVVDPADSLTFLNPDCDFYSWSERMFLWLTSPAPASYGGGGGLILNSSAFFDVSPPDANGDRTLIQHSAGLLSKFPLRAAQVGSHGMPVIMDTAGRLIEVDRTPPKGPPIVRDQAGKQVEIAHARLDDRGKLVLLDRAGAVVQFQISQSPEKRDARKKRESLIAQKFMLDKITFFIDPTLSVITVEQGQAGDSGVLESQTGSLVYYATMVNDVYAYFLTGQKKGAITASQFPLASGDLNNVIAFATANGRPNPPFPDPSALAIEVKSSWVLASKVPDPGDYIRMTATVPTYDTTNPNTWTENGQQTVELALVGLHVVGSTNTHPELVWATFEHEENTPLGDYTYTNSSGGSTKVTQPTSGTWLFSASGAGLTFNQQHMFFVGPPTNAIQSSGSFTISPSNTMRSEPWGTDGTDAPHNTEVISMNNHVLSSLSSGDLRGNYFMTGATWIAFGGPPSTGFQVGNARMSNTTMETYQQGSNCFDCHSDPTMLGAPPPPPKPSVDQGLSHIYEQIKPLF